MTDTEIITIDITKYANALNNLIGIDSAYLNGDKDVDAIVEVIRLAKKMENIIKRQQAEIEEQDQAILNALKRMGEIRAEAIKEFTEYVCDGRVDNDPVVIAVKCAVKEMTEGKK